MSTATDIPSEFICPITYEVMKEPVILSDGHTYERAAILEWLTKRQTSPLSNQRVNAVDIKPNFALRSAIERWQEAQKATPGAAAAGGGTGAPTTVQPKFTFKVRAAPGANALFVECDQAEPLSTAIIAVLDRSGSMSEPAANPNSKAGSEGSLFSRMDLVKHAMRTVAGIANQREASLGIMSFSDTASVDMPLKKMDAAGLADAERAITALSPGGGTHIWDGLRKGLEQAAAFAKANPDTNIHVILLTDGEPTPDYSPLQGIDGALKRRLATLGTRVTISCFGFGYRLDSKLLERLCVEGGGTYGYIPDCSMAGTIFINYCAAALSTAAAHVRVGGKEVGAVQIGVPRMVFLDAPMGTNRWTTVECGGSGAAVEATEATEDEEANAKVVRRLLDELAAVTASTRFSDVSPEGLKATYDWIGDPDGGFRSAVMQDISSTTESKGQILKALQSAEWFGSWGINHLISYMRGLACQQCVNFKEAALQFFAGPEFKKVQAAGNDIFDNLPAPKPSLAYNAYGGSSYYGGGGINNTAAYNLNINMTTFNNANGGCFGGNSQVEMADNTRKYVSQLRAGDIVRGGHRILCVVRTALTARPKMVRLPGLDITPWHPIRTENAWRFPIELCEPVEAPIYAYYNLVLESGHYVRIGNYDVCTLGHGFTDNYVIRHPYFGTRAVIDELAQLPGWSAGLVELNPDAVQRSAETGLINRIT